MANKKKKSRRTSWVTKAINLLVLYIGLSRPISLLLKGSAGIDSIIYEASAGLSKGKFDKSAAMGFYGPILAAIVMKKAISMLRKTARI